MKKIAFVIYRRWAYEIFKNIVAFQKENQGFTVVAVITTLEAEFNIKESEGYVKTYVVKGSDHNTIAEALENRDIDVVFYYGWSWLVKEPVLSKYICLCLHPSRLPEYRGGTPIQHQIIDGVTASAVSVFRMSQGIDDGDIYQQLPMNLSGSLEEIFSRIIELGTAITKKFIIDLINNRVTFRPQEFLENRPPLKRRTPKQSQVFIEDISSFSYDDFYNKVRALADPYPNVFILFPSAKLLIQEVEKSEIVPENSVILNKGMIKNIKDNKKPLYLRLSDSFVFIKKYRVQ